MGAGISQKVLNAHYYRRLKLLQRELISAGVPTAYRQFQLFSGNDAHNGFNISYNTLRASNGETCGMLHVSIAASETHEKEHYGRQWDSAEGIERIKQLFKTK
jgi:hypothetical protein